jgi:guanyl-specific ribonuclease Sa
MSNSSNKKFNLSKKKIIWVIVAIVAVVALYFILTRFPNLNPFGNQATSVPEATQELVIIDGTPDKTQAPDKTPGSVSDTTDPPKATPTQAPEKTASKIDENGAYYSKEDVALYINTYGKLPSNFITKDKAKSMGWSGNGNDPVDKYASGKVIGGDKFGNYEGLLPKKSGRTYYECDIDTKGAVRGVKRIVFSNDGLIYYTEDHYEHFTLLYGKP